MNLIRRHRCGFLLTFAGVLVAAGLVLIGPGLLSITQVELGHIAYGKGLRLLRERPEEPNPYLDRALRLYLSAVKWNPKNAHAWRKLGELYLTLGQNEAARQALMRALSLRPDNVLYHILLGDAYDGLGLPRPAMREWQAGNAGAWRHDQTVVNLLKLADAHIQVGDPLSSIPILRDEVLPLDPHNLFALTTIVVTYDSAIGGNHPLANAYRAELDAVAPEALRLPTDTRYAHYQARAVAELYKRGYWSRDKTMAVLEQWLGQNHPAALPLARLLAEAEPGEAIWRASVASASP